MEGQKHMTSELGWLEKFKLKWNPMFVNYCCLKIGTKSATENSAYETTSATDNDIGYLIVFAGQESGHG